MNAEWLHETRDHKRMVLSDLASEYCMTFFFIGLPENKVKYFISIKLFTIIKVKWWWKAEVFGFKINL